MNELPSHYPDLETFTKINRNFGGKTITDIADQHLIDTISSLMTPEALLAQCSFPVPEAISPQKYPDFEALLGQRERIQNLRLLPVKTVEDRDDYHHESREQMLRVIHSYVADSPLALQVNLFPYFLPPDVEQYIVWLADAKTDRCAIARFVGQAMEQFKLTSDDIILFERPLQTKSTMVRGTVPELRHIHLWFKGENEIVTNYLRRSRL